MVNAFLRRGSRAVFPARDDRRGVPLHAQGGASFHAKHDASSGASAARRGIFRDVSFQASVASLRIFRDVSFRASVASRGIPLACALLFLSSPLHAVTLRVFGSAGAESQLTPANTNSPLNPHNIARIPLATNVSDATTFIDAAPDDRAWKLHLKLRADSSDHASDHGRIGEGYLQINPTPWLDITAGRMIEKWGTGYAWNPTAFISPRKNPTDPTDRRSAFVGVDAIKTDLFIRGTNVSLYAMQHQTFAARVYRLIANTDVSLHVFRDRDGSQQGISVARVFGDSLELHGEVARRRAVIGTQYTFPHNVNVVAELYHGGDGLTQREWLSFCALASRDLRSANYAYAPLRMARNYAFARVDVPFARSDFELIAINNLRDHSSIVRATLSRKMTSRMSVYVIDTEFLGGDGSEFAYIQIRRATTFGARVYF